MSQDGLQYSDGAQESAVHTTKRWDRRIMFSCHDGEILRPNLPISINRFDENDDPIEVAIAEFSQRAIM